LYNSYAQKEFGQTQVQNTTFQQFQNRPDYAFSQPQQNNMNYYNVPQRSVIPPAQQTQQGYNQVQESYDPQMLNFFSPSQHQQQQQTQPTVGQQGNLFQNYPQQNSQQYTPSPQFQQVQQQQQIINSNQNQHFQIPAGLHTPAQQVAPPAMNFHLQNSLPGVHAQNFHPPGEEHSHGGEHHGLELFKEPPAMHSYDDSFEQSFDNVNSASAFSSLENDFKRSQQGEHTMKDHQENK